MMARPRRPLSALLLVLVAGFAPCVMAQGAAEPPVIPFHGDPRMRVERPEGPIPRTLRIITDDEFPPLHFTDPQGQPVGFSVDLMRAVCERLAVNCTIQVRRFDTLVETLAAGQADVIAAALPVTAQLKARFHVSAIYHRFPARFLGRADLDPARVAAGLPGARVAVARETAHAAYLAEHFPAAQRVETVDLTAALAAFAAGEANLVFADGQQLALWLAARPREGARLVGQPYLSVRHFGEGVGFVLRPDEPHLKRAVDHALRNLWEDGVYARLFLRYFPVSPF